MLAKNGLKISITKKISFLYKLFDQHSDVSKSICPKSGTLSLEGYVVHRGIEGGGAFGPYRSPWVLRGFQGALGVPLWALGVPLRP